MNSVKNFKLIIYTLYLFCILTYTFFGYYSIGFDDEFFNIALVNKYNWDFINYTQYVDVHPPGSYFLNLLLFKFFNNWHLVRASIGMIISISVIYFIEHHRKKYSNGFALILLIFLGFNPGLIMYCTGLRWYSFFFAILLYIAIPPNTKNVYIYWSKYFIGFLLLSYISYFSFVIAIPIFLIYWGDKNLHKNYLVILFLFLFDFLLYSYQIYYFYFYHLKFAAGQKSKTIILFFQNFYISIFSNLAIFPIDYFSIISAISVLILSSYNLYKNRLKLTKNLYFLVLVSFSIMLIISGLYLKLHNFIFLIPFYFLFLTKIIYDTSVSNKYIKVLIIIILICNIYGINNIYKHTNTTKTEFNLPFSEVLKIIDTCNCYTLTNNNMLQYNLVENKLPTFIHDTVNFSTKKFNVKKKDLYVFKTWPGSMKIEEYSKIFNDLNKLKFSKKTSYKIGFDNFSNFKKKYNKNYQDYLIEVFIYENVQNIDNLTEWTLINDNNLIYK